MLTLNIDNEGIVTGEEQSDLNLLFPDYDRIRQIERMSILRFMEDNVRYLEGRVLDYGSGTQPYKHLVKGEYFPYEKGDPLPESILPFDAVMCNQVIQFIPDPAAFIRSLATMIHVGGYLILTFPTNWDEVEANDLWRFTLNGMRKLVIDAGFYIHTCQRRAQVRICNFRFPLGYGIVAQKYAVK
jgi:SAM-dependent methyltransferase